MMSAKFDKKVKGIEKKFENFSPAAAGAPAEENQLKSFESKDDDDEYTKLLIKQELEEQLKEVHKKIDMIKV